MPTDGVLMSRGINSNCELGRPADDVPSSRFGHVRLDGVKSIAAGGGHVLAMTSENVCKSMSLLSGYQSSVDGVFMN